MPCTNKRSLVAPVHDVGCFAPTTFQFTVFMPCRFGGKTVGVKPRLFGRAMLRGVGAPPRWEVFSRSIIGSLVENILFDSHIAAVRSEEKDLYNIQKPRLELLGFSAFGPVSPPGRVPMNMRGGNVLGAHFMDMTGGLAKL